MKLFLQHILLILIIGVSFSCRKAENNNTIKFDYLQKDSLYADNNQNSVVIKNPHDTSINIQFQLNNKFWFKKSQMLDAIKNMDNGSLPGVSPNASNAWRFVMQHTFHYNETPLPKTYSYSPSIFINSIGGGLCSNRNTPLSHIWKNLGYNSRCIQLEGHLVTEVYDNNNWHMLDADYHNYYLDNDNKVAGYKALENNINNLHLKYDPNLINPQLINLLFDSKNYNSLFTTAFNNEIQDWYMHHIPWCDIWVELPPHSHVVFPVKTVSEQSAYALGELHIAGHFTGTVDIPFAFYPDTNTQIMGFHAHNNNFKTHKMYPPGKYLVCGENPVLNLYINPLLSRIQETNYLDIYKSQNKPLVTELTQQEYKNRFLDYRQLQIDIFKNPSSQEFVEWTRNNRSKLDTIHIQNSQNVDRSLKWIYTQAYQQRIPDSISIRIEHATSFLDSIQNEHEQLFTLLDNWISMDHLAYYTFFSEGEIRNYAKVLLTETESE
jgi:hypothetical protein